MKKFAVLTQYNPRHGDFYEKIFDFQQDAIDYGIGGNIIKEYTCDAD